MTDNHFMYIYELPHTERKELCRILDQNDKWEELSGKHMQYDVATIQLLRREILRGHSPTEELLTLWGHQNHTVLELFFLLRMMQHYQAMTVIKSFVDPKYHRYITHGEHNINNLIRNLANKNQEPKSVRIPPENFSRSEKVLNAPGNYPQEPQVKREEVVSRENNESVEQKLLKPKSPSPLERVGTTRMLTVSDISTVAESAGAIPQIPYEELQRSTNDWHTSTILGRGGFGIVFEGTWKCTQVAIKRIEQKENNPESHSEQIKQSITELHCLNAIRHDNVLPLYGYSIGGPQPCLVYQYMSGGSLEHRLRIRDPAKLLPWPKRLNVAIGTARGLQFLHTIFDKPLIHGDIKAANILLDPNDMPKIGDFGLAREGPRSNYTHIKVSKIHGTRPYLPDEYLRTKNLSTKVDTYSFGVVLFEIATALGAYSDRRKDKFLSEFIVNYEGNLLELKDSRVENGEDCFESLISIGKLCVRKKSKDRPEMVDVLKLLEGVDL